MDNQNRSVFSIHGITGMLIATVLLLSILVGLTIWGLNVQQEQIRKPYKLENIEQVKMRESKSLDDFRKDVK
ncbi:DUF4006 family protein [Campylobacter canadensis]|uniref:DUF4006 family protein n=1 Tax=Campylobacter canadensis TaxID=449520 RepID=UPI0015536B18|nr:DUF4006 family protein [Campylobacter canadensis]MBZ7994292.1 DUF4006 family protein [Campylobacter canadensis]MBZ7995716.1 DUF4006 family protein [Campylobacter canadensis]MBZ7999624.1 DUF4006 family protein [Campylobacter canadensis]MBZ8001289.1 DUF4006 family protein [Campylobacter canadensis]MBZ8004314.1 DUF4006 family protein [Campylobacter canadensis]